MELLDKIALQRGVDQQSLRDLFGCKKHYNASLLTGTLAHEDVSSEAVQNLVSPSNNKMALQSVFGQDSEIES